MASILRIEGDPILLDPDGGDRRRAGADVRRAGGLPVSAPLAGRLLLSPAPWAARCSSTA